MVGRYEQAVELARECGHPEYGRAALVDLGRYDEAAKLTAEIPGPFGDNPVYAMIGAGQWREAAAHFDNQQHRDADSARCIGRYLRSIADGTPLEPVGSATKACRIIDGVFDDKADEYEASVGSAHWAFGGGSPNFPANDLARWLSAFATDDSYRTHAMRAEQAMDLGRLDVAAAEIEAAAARIHAGVDDEGRRAEAMQRRALPNLLALRTGAPIAAFELDERFSYEDDEAALLRGGANPSRLPKAVSRLHPAVVTALSAAAEGDGRPLAELFERATDRVLGLRLADEYLLAIAPLVKKHRDELVRAIKNRSRRRADVHEIAIERDVLRMLGDTAGAARLQAIVDRHAKALGDKEKLKALLLLEAQ